MMHANENPGLQAGAYSDLLGGWSRSSITAIERQRQSLSRRFVLSPWLASQIAVLCFGGSRDD